MTILLDHQDRDGSWLSGDGNDRSGGRNYCTASAVLALTTVYGRRIHLARVNSEDGHLLHVSTEGPPEPPLP